MNQKKIFLKIKDNNLKIIETLNKDLPPLIFLKEQEIKGIIILKYMTLAIFIKML